MLPLLALRQPTGARLSENKVEVKIRWVPSGTVTLETRTIGNVSTPELDWVLAWVGRQFGRGTNYDKTHDQWPMTRYAFNATVKQMNSEVNTPGTYRNATPWTLEKSEQKLEDTDGTQHVRLVFAIG